MVELDSLSLQRGEVLEITGVDSHLFTNKGSVY